MIRIKLLLIVAGCVIAYFGWKETILSRNAKPEAGHVSAEALEEYKIPENAHVLVDHAIALYPYYVYQYSKSKTDNSDPTANTHVDYVLYPVISMNHPLVKALESGQADKATIDKALSSVSIVVKTHQFATKGSIPTKIQQVDNLDGLIINRVESLEKKEVELLHQSFPQMDPSKVVFIEQGRLPKPLSTSLSMIGGGVLAVLLGGFWALARR